LAALIQLKKMVEDFEAAMSAVGQSGHGERYEKADFGQARHDPPKIGRL
jgi:hypothetical protein